MPARHAQSGAMYQTECETIKFFAGEMGSLAAEYDQNRKSMAWRGSRRVAAALVMIE